MTQAAGSGAPPARGLRGWLAGRTLRTRLIAGLVALLFVACAAVGVVTYAAMNRALLNQVDNQLKEASQRYYNCLHPPPRPDNDGDGDADNGAPPGGNAADCYAPPGQPAYTLSAQITQGVVLNPATTTGPCKLSEADDAILTAMPHDGAPYTATLSGFGPYRLMAVQGPNGTVYVSGVPLSSMIDTVHDVAYIEIIVFALALFLTAFLGTGWVRLSLRPLRRVTATAAEVARLPLASEVDVPHRVPDADPRTEVGQLGAAFNRMLGHVENALERREASEARLRRFAADASHELRTPLAAIRGYAELARRHPDSLPADVAHALGRVESESARMSALVEDLLLLARLDAGRPLESRPVDLTRLAIDATSDARAAGPDHRWQLELPEGPVLVPGDGPRLHQVLANLLSNARTHTPAGTTVTVTVGSVPDRSARDHGAAELSVTDDGPGIPAELQPDLFERFVRGDSSRSRAAGSTGLGLSIVAAVVAAHHGTVGVTSQPGRTRFLITLPLLPDPAAPSEASQPT
jgi:two-component system, OmpR family, sensor kinase